MPALRIPEKPDASRGRTISTWLRKPFYGWWIVAASALTNGVGGSIQFQGFTVLFLPVASSLGLNYAQTALIFSLSRAENGVIGPITGWLIDRFGVRPLMLGGTVIVGIGYLILAQTTSYRDFVLVYLFVIALGASTAFMQSTTTALNHWFISKRGMVMAINSAAFRLGGAVMVPVLSVVVLRYGWQTAAVWIGVMMIAFIAPLALVFRRSPEQYGLRPDGDKGDSSPNRRVGSQQTTGEDDWGVREALRTREFYVLAAGTVLRISVHGAIFVHIIPILVWKGQSQQAAANMVGLLALAAVPVILVLGWVSDRIGRQKLLSGAYVVSGVGLLLLVFVHGTVPVFLVLLLFAGTEAGSSLNWALVGDLFGRRRFATLRGMLAPMYNSALVVTPIAAGWVFDETGSYSSVLLAGGGLLFAAAVVFYNLHIPKRAPGTAGARTGAADRPRS